MKQIYTNMSSTAFLFVLVLMYTHGQGGSADSGPTTGQREVIAVGERIEINCEVTGNPPPVAKWIKVDGPMSSQIIMEGTFLIIPSFDEEDQGTYRCVASSVTGTVYAQVTLIVTDDEDYDYNYDYDSSQERLSTDVKNITEKESGFEVASDLVLDMALQITAEIKDAQATTISTRLTGQISTGSIGNSTTQAITISTTGQISTGSTGNSNFYAIVVILVAILVHFY